MATLNERLLAIEKNIDEGADEVVKEIAKLREQLAGGTVTPEALATLDRLDTKGQALADIIPNAPEVPAGDMPPPA